MRYLSDTFLCYMEVISIKLNADELPAKLFGYFARGTATEVWIQYKVSRAGASENDTFQQIFWFLRRVFAVRFLSRFR